MKKNKGINTSKIIREIYGQLAQPSLGSVRKLNSYSIFIVIIREKVQNSFTIYLHAFLLNHRCVTDQQELIKIDLQYRFILQPR